MKAAGIVDGVSMIRCCHLIRREQMVKCNKSEVRWLKTALRWKIPAVQRERIQMVLLRDAAGGCRSDGRVAESGQPGAHGL
jgi:hypothetical protein